MFGGRGAIGLPQATALLSACSHARASQPGTVRCERYSVSSGDNVQSRHVRSGDVDMSDPATLSVAELEAEVTTLRPTCTQEPVAGWSLSGSSSGGEAGRARASIRAALGSRGAVG